MKKKLLSLALALVMCLGLFVVPASAAGAALTEILSADTYDSIEPRRNYWPDFSEGIAWISGRNTGAIDTTGKIIVKPGTYEYGLNFSDSVAWAHRDSKWCLVDKTGKELFTLEDSLEVDSAEGSSNFHDGLARVRSKESGTYGYIDKTGKLVIPCQYDYRAGSFHNGLARVYDSANAFYGYIDKAGRVAIPYQYASATDFVNGFAHVQLGKRQTVIDTTGRELISQEYTCNVDWTEDWEDYVGSAEVVLVHQTGGDWAFVNKAGQIVSGGYQQVMRFADGMVGVTKDKKHGFVNESGALVIPCTLSGNRYSFRDGYVAVPNGTEVWNILDKTGRVTGTRQVKSGYSLANAGNGCFIIQSNESGRNRYGFVDCTGREIVPCKYKAVSSKGFSGGVAAVQNFDDKWGFVDTNGNEILPCTLSEVVYTSEPGIFIVTNYSGDGRVSLVKSSGWTAPTQPTAPVTPPAVSTVGNFTDVKESDWFASPVLWAVEKGITSGTSKNTFSPGKDCTVAQILTFLYQAYGAPKTSGSNPFTDVKESDWYYSAARWAYEQGIVSDSTFGGSQPCTRSMAVTYMWKAAGSPSAKAAGFSDVPSSADCAQAVAWAVEKGVTNGTSTTTFSPDKVCTRGQIVTFLYAALAK